MVKDRTALSDDPKQRQAQEKAIKKLEDAFKECGAAGLVFLRQGAQAFVFDEDKLFAAGWTNDQPAIRFLGEIGMCEIVVHDTVIRNKFADVDGDEPL